MVRAAHSLQRKEFFLKFLADKFIVLQSSHCYLEQAAVSFPSCISLALLETQAPQHSCACRPSRTQDPQPYLGPSQLSDEGGV